jgi:AGZA family xanthine/uracil permease-like MFS transporter
VPNAATTVTLGNLRDKSTALAIFGLLLMAALLAWRVRAAMLIGILATTGIGLATGVAKWAPQPYRLSDLSATAGKLDLAARCASASWKSSSCSCSSTCSTTSERWWRWASAPICSTSTHQIPRVNRILLSDATATIVGSLTGTSTVVSYIESAAGVAGRRAQRRHRHRHRPAVRGGAVRGPGGGRHPRRRHRAGADHRRQPHGVGGGGDRLEDPEVAVPAFLTMMTIPLTFSIANGLAFGFTAYTLLKVRAASSAR